MKQRQFARHTEQQARFATLPDSLPPFRSALKRNFTHLTTMNPGYLIPIFRDEIIPGDTINLRPSVFARLSTIVYPTLHNMYIDLHFFFIPFRLVWDNWVKMCGEQTDPGDSTDYITPTMTSPAPTGYGRHSLSDYFGIPTLVTGLEHSSLYHRSYNLVYNEWYRDENLVDSVVVDKDDGPDDPADYTLLKRRKRPDYFTTGLPWPQKGDAVTLPLGTSAPVVSSGTGIPLFDVGATTSQLVGNATTNVYWNAAISGGPHNAVWETTALEADLTSATAATINTIRQAFQMQKLLEKDARGGTRYIETLKQHYGVTSPDFRLQRPEYLGGGSIPVITQAVEATARNVSPITYVGDLGGYGAAAGNLPNIVKSFTEHGCIIGIASIRADLTYQQGLHRDFSRVSRHDYYWPVLTNIGEQAILNKELYADASANDDLVFAYQERHSEYRYKPSIITGAFRSNDALSLDYAHLAQHFASLPVLGQTFIEETPPIDRILQIPSSVEPAFFTVAQFSYIHTRPMPMYSIPGHIDHF